MGYFHADQHPQKITIDSPSAGYSSATSTDFYLSNFSLFRTHNFWPGSPFLLPSGQPGFSEIREAFTLNPMT